MPAAVPPGIPAQPPGRPTRQRDWRAVLASERGAAHVAAGTPSQDAFAAEDLAAAGLVAAVADGHGHWRHFRSDRGSRFAVQIGCEVGRELADQLGEAEAWTGAELAAELTGSLAPAVVRRWHEEVLADLTAEPLTADEQELRLPGDDPTIAYGSTLLLGIIWRHWLMLAQIGDGDIVCVRRDGQALLPVPGDPQLDGRFTTSLCSPDAVSDVRVGVVDTVRTPLLAVLMATDGYGNAQAADPWAGAFSKDIAGLLRQRGPGWLAGQLKGWVARCASPDGSADDTTVALLLAPDRELAGDPEAGLRTPTLPLPSEAATLPAEPPGEAW